MWKEDLHPRDEYGRFRLIGSAGVLDLPAAVAQGRRHRAAIDAWERNQAIQSRYKARRDAGTLTAAEDDHWDVVGEEARGLLDAVPKAYHMGFRPNERGFWRRKNEAGLLVGPERDAEGRLIPSMAVKGATRVGDNPDKPRQPNDSPLAGGLWHMPGDYYPGRIPKLVDDNGYTSNFRPAPSKSREHRYHEGAFVRAELRAERFGGHRAAEFSTRDDPATTLASAEVQGAFMIDPLNPVSRRRSARKKRQRQQNVTWVQRLNARMEGR